MKAWLLIIVLAVGTVLMKTIGPVLAGGRATRGPDAGDRPGRPSVDQRPRRGWHLHRGAAFGDRCPRSRPRGRCRRAVVSCACCRRAATRCARLRWAASAQLTLFPLRRSARRLTLSQPWIGTKCLSGVIEISDLFSCQAKRQSAGVMSGLIGILRARNWLPRCLAREASGAPPGLEFSRNDHRSA